MKTRRTFQYNLVESLKPKMFFAVLSTWQHMLCLLLFALRVSGRSIKAFDTPCPVACLSLPHLVLVQSAWKLHLWDTVTWCSMYSVIPQTHTLILIYYRLLIPHDESAQTERHLLLYQCDSPSFFMSCINPVVPLYLPKLSPKTFHQAGNMKHFSAPFTKMTTCAVLIMLSDFKTPNSLRTSFFVCFLLF